MRHITMAAASLAAAALAGCAATATTTARSDAAMRSGTMRHGQMTQAERDLMARCMAMPHDQMMRNQQCVDLAKRHPEMHPRK
jgi:hypothetical protein